MKPFRFRADALLHLRRRDCDEAEAVLARAHDAKRAAVAEVEAAAARRDAAGERFTSDLRSDGDASTLERHRNWIAHLGTEVRRLETVCVERDRAVSTALDALRVAHQQVRVLERLREKSVQRYDLAGRRQEMKDIDQIATLQHARRSIQGGSES